MVGTIQTTVNEGDEVKRGEEYGYFAFGRLRLIWLSLADFLQVVRLLSQSFRIVPQYGITI